MVEDRLKFPGVVDSISHYFLLYLLGLGVNPSFYFFGTPWPKRKRKLFFQPSGGMLGLDGPFEGIHFDILGLLQEETENTHTDARVMVDVTIT